jgi:iron complex outermembrane receptor protein
MLGYGDKPYGADQFYGPFNSWERTKSRFAGLKQDLGKNTEFDFGFRQHTDEFVLFRNDPAFFENNHIDRSWQTDLRRHDKLSQNSTLFMARRGFTRILKAAILAITRAAVEPFTSTTMCAL